MTTDTIKEIKYQIENLSKKNTKMTDLKILNDALIKKAGEITS